MTTIRVHAFASVAVSGVILAALGSASQATVAADPLPFGPDTCAPGFVWREAIPSDHVCVTPDRRSQTAAENADAVQNRDPNGAYGSNSCKQGFVWRNAFNGDAVCVVPSSRDEAAADNAAGPSRVAKPASTSSGTGNVVFEVTGSGSAFTIDTDPSTQRFYDVHLPWSHTTTIGPDVHMLQVIAVGKDTPGPGCRILLDGRVVAEKAPGGDAHCVFDR
jgi:hypothetical protein